MKIIRIALSFFIFLSVCTWSTYVLSDGTIGTPSPVNITNDGYNSAGIEDKGAGYALDVNILSGGTLSVDVSSLPSVTVQGTVAISNPVTSVTTSALGNTPVTQATTPWNVGGTVAVSSLPSITGTVTISNPVTSVTTSALGTTPVSGSVSVSNMIPAVETGLAKASTQTDGSQKTQVTSIPAITGTVSVSNMVTSVTTSALGTTPVSGTFWQTTQPVSIATMPTTPVTGTFWQATQPVSGTVSVSNMVSSVTTSALGTTPVSGTVTANQGTSPWTGTTVASTTVSHNQVGVGNTATLIVASNASRRSLLVRNQGTSDMYVGASSVTTATGMLVKRHEVLVLDRTSAALYGITSSASTTVGYVEE